MNDKADELQERAVRIPAGRTVLDGDLIVPPAARESSYSYMAAAAAVSARETASWHGIYSRTDWLPCCSISCRARKKKSIIIPGNCALILAS